ncbi:hypothetical protein PA598K_01399 [Paenibacillus sp. 598K]|uniref:DUF1802 family protein n=1 Tax=Paenibacillus sp. 598K TaxID=1117987 RepID=UPI000FFA1511|nr:DUF1802 family protein [Paenibacillus sp. 598K]GBF73114.1 hypothetical protein PA598K_01399 [Paenibacillus sp. 598K]
MNNRATNGGREAVALKEWAVVVRALASGEQILLLRKGGIAEEAKAFQLLSPAFYLMETYEHQKAELLKPEAQATLQDTLREWQPDAETVQLSLYGEVTEELEIRDQETLDKLYPYHIWTQEMAEQRLRWKRKQPLHLLLIRAWRLTEAAHVPMRAPYLGCKSWVSIEDDVPQSSLEPVLTDTEYEARCRQIRAALG